jgi:hypothetical protein
VHKGWCLFLWYPNAAVGVHEDQLSLVVEGVVAQDAHLHLYVLLERVAEHTGGLLRLPLVVIVVQRPGSVYMQEDRTDSLYARVQPS